MSKNKKSFNGSKLNSDWAANQEAVIRARQRAYLLHIAARPISETESTWFLNSGLIASLTAGDHERANALIRKGTEICLALQTDCIDFFLNLLHRAWFLFPDAVSPDNRQRIRQATLASRYYGGHNDRYPMFYSSENHHLCWATAEYLTAQRFPDDRFSFDGRSAKEHHARARFLIANWIDRRARWGYSEWNSSAYMGTNLMSLLNLVDFAAEPDLRLLAERATTKLLADLAADSLNGGIWCAQARAYEPNVFSAYEQTASPALPLLLGAGDSSGYPAIGGAGEFPASTGYRPPRWLCTLACDADAPLLNEERHRMELDHFYSCRSAFWRPPFELTNEAARQAFTPHSLVDAPIRTERTAETIVSAAIVTPKGKAHGQGIYWMGCLRGTAPIFTTQPFAADMDRATDRYWAGTSSAPRCYVREGIVAAVYAGGASSAPFTHAHFPTAAMDEWTQRGNWFFARLGEAYAAVRAPDGARLTTDGPWAGREIIASGLRAAWIAVFGSRRSRGGFTDFIAYCLNDVRVEVAPESTAVSFLAAGLHVHVSYAEGVTEDGVPFSCADWPQMNNAIVQHPYGGAVTRITPPGEAESQIDFSAAETICAEWENRD